MKRTTLYISAALALAFALAGCTQDEPADGNRLPEGEYPVIIQATGLSVTATPQATPATRATVDGDWQGVDTVALQVGNEVKKYAVTASDADGYRSATLSRTADPFYWTSRNPMTVSAWWPLDDTDITQMLPVVVEQDQSTQAGFAASDFIAAIDRTVQFDNPTLEFTHRTARVVVKLVPGTGFTSVDGVTVSLVSLSTKSGNPSTIDTYHAGNTHEALAVPQTIGADKPFIQVMLNGTTYIYRLSEELIMAAGKRYTYTIRVNATGLTLEGCTIGDWTDDGGEEGDATILDYTISDDGRTYTVYNAKGLLAWAEATKSDPTLSCTLAADIDLTGIDWTPVGNNNNPYTGTFDGGGHTITGLTINLPGQEYVGLIGYLGSGGKVMNVTLTDIQIEIESNNHSVYAGGVVGYCNEGTLENCFTSGSVSGTSSYGSVYVGGVAGRNNSGTVTGCYATGSVSGTGSNSYVYIGGVVGRNSGTVTGCYATGSVSGTGLSVYVGGVVGRNSGTVTGCYAMGDVSGTAGRSLISYAYVGGVVGENDGTVTGCYATGDISGTGRSVYVGGVVGRNYNGTVTGCYWSVYDGNGIGDGSGETTKVDGTAVTWETAQSGMNTAIDTWNANHSDKLCNWQYANATATAPPTLVASSNP